MSMTEASGTASARLRLFATPSAVLDRRDDGTMILRCPIPPPPDKRCIGDWLTHWATIAPERDFLCERIGATSDAPWRRLTYGRALTRVEAIGTWLLQNDVTSERPLLVLSENSIDHGLLSLAACHVGVPIASISTAYSLVSKDYAKLKAIVRIVTPGAIFVSDAQAYSGALAAIAHLHDAHVVAGRNAGDGVTSLAEVAAHTDTALVRAAFAALTPETVAKILFTSGSTGEPKGVVNTQRMLTFGQEGKAWEWPFLEREPPVVLDWLPWSHTFGANHNFNLILRNGGTLYIDGGRPAPGLFQRTLDNIRDVPATIAFNVPAAYGMLVHAMCGDAALREAFFKHLRVVFYAAAALPQNIWDDLRTMAQESVGAAVPLVSGWGSTETAPLATDCYFQAERSGNIGLPAPGVDLKLVPNAGKLEIRVRGPNVMPGYWRRPDLTQAAFDDEGFYRIGDTVRFADEARPEAGLYFDGRVSEDFKLTSGTWVSVGQVRVNGVAHLAPLAQDIVVAGQDRGHIGFLVFPNIAGCRQVAAAGDDAALADILAHEAVVAHLREALARMKKESGGSSTYAACALLLHEPPSVDAGEITDKGYINQRAVLTRRAADVERLYSGDDGIIAV